MKVVAIVGGGWADAFSCEICMSCHLLFAVGRWVCVCVQINITAGGKNAEIANDKFCTNQ